jgi:hypothetical protein
MNHKRGKPKSARAGCLLCKPHKANGCKHERPFSEQRRDPNAIRERYGSEADQRESRGNRY